MRRAAAAALGWEHGGDRPRELAERLERTEAAVRQRGLAPPRRAARRRAVRDPFFLPRGWVVPWYKVNMSTEAKAKGRGNVSDAEQR